MSKLRNKAINRNVSAIHIGADKEGSIEISKHILAVLMTPTGDAVKIAAMQALRDASQVNGTVIHNSNFQMKA